MRLNNPDLINTMQRQAYSSMELFGTKIDWRKYVSSSGSYNEFGQFDVPQYRIKKSLWQIKQLSPRGLEELQQIGGEEYAGGYEVFTQDHIGVRDEMRYRGQIYRCVGVPYEQHIGDAIWWQAMFAIASASAIMR